MVRSLYRYRQLIWANAVADLRHRYAGSSMGVFWNVLHPLALIAVYTAIFTTFVGGKMKDIPGPFGYAIFLCAGFFPWIAFGDCLGRCTTAITGNAHFLKKMPVPEQVFILQVSISALLTLALSFVLYTAIALAMGLRPSVHWLLVPIPLIALLVFSLGIGTMLGALQPFFTDIAQILGVVMQVLFWLTPIIYKREDAIPFVKKFSVLNPLTPSIEAARDLFLFHRMPEPWTWFAMAAWAIVAILLGQWVLGKLRGEIRDVI